MKMLFPGTRIDTYIMVEVDEDLNYVRWEEKQRSSFRRANEGTGGGTEGQEHQVDMGTASEVESRGYAPDIGGTQQPGTHSK